MTFRLLALTWALSCGWALAAPVSVPQPKPDSTPASSITIPRWAAPLTGLPPPDDPQRVNWRESNENVFRLGGHVGHWRGTLKSPAPERRP